MASKLSPSPINEIKKKTAMPTPPPLAAIDIGSNAIRLGVAVIDRQGKLRIVATAREAVRLGGDVFSKGAISRRMMRKASAALRRLGAIAAKHGAIRIRTVATSALREATNQEDFCRFIEEETGISVEVIDGSEEAQLIYRAVGERINLSHQVGLLIDIGGGSVEVSLAVAGVIVFADSIRAGAVRLLQFMEDKNPSIKVLNRFIRQYTYGITKQVDRELELQTITCCVGTGGNIEALGELAVQLLGAKDPMLLSVTDVAKLSEKLSSMSVSDRIARLNLRPDRADVILPAAVVLHQVAASAGVSHISIPKVGLREGVILSMDPEKPGLSLIDSDIQPVAYALDLGRRLSFDEGHGVAVARHAEALFTATAPLHRLPNECKLLLRLAALLHDVGQVISMAGHHKHSYYIISTSPFLGISKRQRQIVATIARYHRKASPSMKHAEFGMLDDSDREIVRQLSALLRIADALDREHLGRVLSFRVALTGNQVALSLEGDGDCVLERWAVKKKGALFCEVFGKRVVVEE
jgi:exopolyphosphatase/guanosine-5'-triphosphate,3'-diphosphate pyrophosphatase